MKFTKFFLIFVTIVFGVSPCATAATDFDLAWVFSENRSFDPEYFPFSSGHPYYNGNAFWYMVTAAEVVGDNPYPVIFNSPPGYQLPVNSEMGYFGIWGPFNQFSVGGYTGGGGFAAPGNEWENKNYTFTVDGVTKNFFIPSGSIQQVPVVQNVVIDGQADPFHPTITWDPVSGVDEYTLTVCPIGESGYPYCDAPLFLSGILSQSSYTYTGSLLSDWQDYVIWIQARQLHPYSANPTTYPDYTDAIINRSSFFTRYSADHSISSESLANAAGWSEYIDTPTVVFTPDSVDSEVLHVQANASTDQDAWGMRSKYFQNQAGDQALGAITTVQVSAIGGYWASTGLRGYISKTANNHKILAEIYLQYWGQDNEYSIRYRVRQKDSLGKTVRTIARGSLGNYKGNWGVNQKVKIGFAVVNGQLYFYRPGNGGLISVKGLNAFPTTALTPEEGAGVQITATAEQNYGDAGITPGSITAKISDLKVIYPDQLLVFGRVAAGLTGDTNEDGQIGLEEAIYALQVVSGTIDNNNNSGDTIPTKTITVDGSTGDWVGVNPVTNDPMGDDDTTVTGDDVKALYVAKDSTYLYLRMDLWESVNPNFLNGPSPNNGRYNFHIERSDPQHTLAPGIAYDTSNSQWSVGHNGSNGGDLPVEYQGSEFVGVSGSVIELKLPLTYLNDINDYSICAESFDGEGQTVWDTTNCWTP